MRALSQNERFIFEEPISLTLPSSSLKFFLKSYQEEIIGDESKKNQNNY
jgi:hypothetical protein